MCEVSNSKELKDLCKEFISISLGYYDYTNKNGAKWEMYISKMCTIHYNFGTWITSQDKIDEDTLNTYMTAGDLLATELKLLNDWAKVEALYHHSAYIYKNYANEIDPNELLYCRQEEQAAQIKKNEEKSSGCLGCLGILIVVGILYKILF